MTPFQTPDLSVSEISPRHPWIVLPVPARSRRWRLSAGFISRAIVATEVGLSKNPTSDHITKSLTDSPPLASCRFEHPGADAGSNPFGAPNANRFNALNNPATKLQDAMSLYKLSKESIKVDLAEERPSWILSCYGPGKDAPEQLFGGFPREQSLEEVMVYIKGSANQQQAVCF